MSEYEPIDLERDTRHLINQLTAVGLMAGTYVSRASLERGNDDPVTVLFDNAAQRITVTLLEFQTHLAKIEQGTFVNLGDHVEEPFVSDGL